MHAPDPEETCAETITDASPVREMCAVLHGHWAEATERVPASARRVH